MRCGTLRFGSVAVRWGAVRCGTICDRVRAKGPYGIEIDFEKISAKFGKFRQNSVFQFKLRGRHPTV